MARTRDLETGKETGSIVERQIAKKEMSEDEINELFKKSQDPQDPNTLEKLLKKMKENKKGKA